MKLLTLSNTKTRKGEARGYVTFILHLAPGNLSGFNVCPGASKGCLASCLNTAGRGRFAPVQNARIAKTRRFFEDRAGFMADLAKDIAAAVRFADRRGLGLAIRLNGTSDIRWETVPVAGARNIFERFPAVTFYDYTKLANRRNLPPNYRLTFSRAEHNDAKVPDAIGAGHNVAVVFDTGKTAELPRSYRGLPVIDGDADDLRFLDPAGVVIGLRAKGSAKSDRSGFVVAAV